MAEKTALYEAHQQAGGKMVEFAGWMLPVQYTAGVIAEHMAVRQNAGIFDVSHMGEVVLQGEGAEQSLQHLLCNDMSGMAIGSCRYSPMCNHEGGVVDDLIVYRQAPQSYMLVVNASNRKKDVDWMRENLLPNTQLQDISDTIGQLALQGPKAEAILTKLVDESALPKAYYYFKEDVMLCGVPCIVSRTGYTGEDGFEVYCEAEKTPILWEALMQAGEPLGLLPCGLAARDTLRLEAGMPLYGHEIDSDVTPQQAGLGMFVKMDKGDFIGRAALQEKGQPTRRRVGLRVTSRGIAREGADVYAGGRCVGRVTSGTMLPYAGYAGAMALIDADAYAPTAEFEVDVRGRMLSAQVVPLPFYKRGQ